MNNCRSLSMQPLRYGRCVIAGAGNQSRIHRPHGSQRLQEKFRFGNGFVFPSLAPMKITVASIEQLLETLRATQGVRIFKQTNETSCPHLRTAANVAMITGNQQRQIPALSGCLKVSAHIAHKLHAPLLMAGMPR